jgi:hypothetical protein
MNAQGFWNFANSESPLYFRQHTPWTFAIGECPIGESLIGEPPTTQCSKCICKYLCDSSKRDFNRVLATQPRRSIIMPRFEQPNTPHQERPSNPFTVSIYKNWKVRDLYFSNLFSFMLGSKALVLIILLNSFLLLCVFHNPRAQMKIQHVPFQMNRML